MKYDFDDELHRMGKGIPDWVFGLMLLAFAVVLLLTIRVVSGEYSEEPPEFAAFPPTTGSQLILIRRVIDGDSISGFFLVPFKGRLSGIDAPELDTPEGKRSKEALKSRLTEMQLCKVMLKGTDKYSRILLEPFDGENKSICEWMCDKRYAVPYDGGKR